MGPLPRRPKLQLCPLEDRTLPSGVMGPDRWPTKVYDDGPAVVQTPAMPGLSALDFNIAAAVQQAWLVPEGSRTAEWCVQLPEGTSVSVLNTLGVYSAEAVPFWPNAFNVKFTEEYDVGTFASTLAAVTPTRFFYPLFAVQLEKYFTPNDPFFPQQWHLQNTGQSGGVAGADANVTTAWDVLNAGNQPVRGTGVVVGVLDDGLQWNHPDLAAAYSSANSWDFNDNDADPYPMFTNHSHGTNVAGVAAGRGNNNIGVAGAAPSATLAGLRILGGATTDAVAGAALSYRPQNIHVYNNSWGPPPVSFYAAGGLYSFMGPQTMSAMFNGVSNGRGGKGSIYVNSAGNDAAANQDVNYNAFSSSRFGISVGATSHQDLASPYSEPGAALFISAPSLDEYVTGAGITTTDLTGTAGFNPQQGLTDYADQDYTRWFSGTSSAAPLVSGIVALMLDANPNLSWRDVKHILARTARKINPTDAGWSTNGAGFNIHHQFGFGVINAAAAVTMARTWTSVATEQGVASNVISVNQTIPDNSTTGVTQTINVTSPSWSLEHVEVLLNITHDYPHDLRIVLTSPSGTQSVLAKPFVVPTAANANISNWIYTSTRHWGETSLGTWTLKITDEIGQDVGTFVDWRIAFYGTTPSAPTLTGMETTALTYNAGQAATNITQTLAPADSDALNLTGATVSIGSAGFVSGQDFLRYTSANGILGSFSSATGILTLTGNASLATYQNALRSIKFENTAANPTTGTRTVSFVVRDATNQTSTASTRNITVTAPVNQAPVLGSLETSTLNYTAGQGAATMTQTLTVTDPNGSNISGATISITNNLNSSQDSLSFTPQSGIQQNYDSNTGVLTLTGNATPAQYEAALRSVKYTNSSATPSTLTRTVTFRVTDAGNANSNTLSRNISVSVAANIPPVLDNLEPTAINYTAGQGAINLTQTLTIADTDSTSLSGATVRVATNHNSTQDLLEFTNTGTISGSFDSATGVLTLTGTSSVANYEAALRSVQYRNTSVSPSTLARDVRFRVTDTTSQNSNELSRTINISVPSSNTPILSNIEPNTLNYNAGQGDAFVTQSISITDADSSSLSGATIALGATYVNGQDVLKFTQQNGITPSFNSATGLLTLTGTATVAQYITALRSVRYENTAAVPNTTTRTVTFRVTDPTNLTSDPVSRSITLSTGGTGVGTLGFVEATLSATETNAVTNLVVKVRRSGGTTGAVGVSYATQEQTATSGSDYVSSTGTLQWADGEGGDKTFTVAIRPDSFSEGAEAFLLAISNLTGGASVGLSEAVVTIAMNDLLVLSPVNRVLAFMDDDGDIVTTKLSGNAGTASIALTNGKGPIDTIQLTGTDPLRTALSISVKKNRLTSTDNGRVSLGRVVGSGLAKLTGKAVNLDGAGIALDAPVKSIVFADIRNGADILTTGLGLGVRTAITVGVVEDGTTIQLENPLRVLKAASFGEGNVVAPSAGTIAIRGNFLADLTLTGDGVLLGKPTLNALKVSGNIDGSMMQVLGNVNLVQASSFRNSDLLVGARYDENGGLVFDFPSQLKTFKVTGGFDGFQNARVAATSFRSIYLRSVDTDNEGTSFGFMADLALGKVKVAFPAFTYLPLLPGAQGMGDFAVEVL